MKFVVCAVGLCACRLTREQSSNRASAAQPSASAASALTANVLNASAPSANGVNHAPATRREPRPRVRRVGDLAMIDAPGPWARSCLIHQGCRLKLQPVKRCELGQTARAWSTVGVDANALDGTRVALSGPLDLADGAFSSMVACKAGTCCNGVQKNVVLGEPPHALALDGLTCRGDESRLCCNVLARGQSVIVNGTLRRVGPIWWELEDASLCEVGE